MPFTLQHTATAKTKTVYIRLLIDCFGTTNHSEESAVFHNFFLNTEISSVMTHFFFFVYQWSTCFELMSNSLRSGLWVRAASQWVAKCAISKLCLEVSGRFQVSGQVIHRWFEIYLERCAIKSEQCENVQFDTVLLIVCACLWKYSCFMFCWMLLMFIFLKIKTGKTGAISPTESDLWKGAATCFVVASQGMRLGMFCYCVPLWRGACL